MPTDLTPAEKDDRQVERLIDKKPVPSRKPAGRGGPKHDNRRRRMKDPSEEKKDEELRKTKASLFVIAARVAVKEEEIHQKGPSVEEAKRLVEVLLVDIGRESKPLRDLFEKYVKDRYAPHLNAATPDPKKIKKIVKGLRQRAQIFETASNTKFGGSPADVAAKIAQVWPSGKPNNWAERAGVIAALQNAIKQLKAPASIKAKMLREPGNAAKDKELIKNVLEEAKDGKISKDLLEDSVELEALVAGYRTLLENPDTVDAASLTRKMDDVTEEVYSEVQKLLMLPSFMKSWEKAAHAFSDGKIDTSLPEDTKSTEFYKDVQHSLSTFFEKDQKPVFDPDEFIDGLESVLGSDFKNAPDELKEMVEGLRRVVKGYKSAATSYDAPRVKAMRQRTATYHGVLQQGDPTNGPYTGYRSLDRRYFGKEHYDSIIKTAKEFLKEDWLKYDWEGGAKDAPFRAALDLSIWVADSNLYQAKIDGETYNMLLARLMKSKTDVFSETLITYDEKDSRRASAMSNQHYQAILRVASGLRKENPRAALEIVKNLRSLVAQEQQSEQNESDDEQGAPAAGKPPAVQSQEQQQSQQQQGQQQQQGALKAFKTKYDQMGNPPGQMQSMMTSQMIKYLDADPSNALIVETKLGTYAVFRGAGGGADNFFYQELPISDPNDAEGGDLTAEDAIHSIMGHPGVKLGPLPGGGGNQQGQQQQQQSQQQQQGQVSDADTDAFVEGKVDIKDLKNHLKKVVDSKSIEDFVDGLMEMDELLKKTASGRVAQEQQQQQGQEQQQGQQEQTGAIMDLEALEDMDEAQVDAFLGKIKTQGDKILNENDIEKFMDGLDGIFGEAENAAKSVKTGSVTVAMSTLVRLAHSNPEARSVLLPIIVAAAKKKKKKDKRKKDKADKKKGKKPNPFAKGGDKAKGGKGGKPPFGGKKAPPFGGKKAPPFGKKKSSVDIDPSDTKW